MSVLDRPKPTAGTRWTQGYAAVLFLFYAAMILMHRQPPLLGDLSNWAYSGVIVARHMHGLPDAFHSIRHYPVPNTLNTLLLAVLCFFMRWQLAIKVYLLLQLVLSYCSLRALARAVDAPAWVWLIAPSAVFFGINFWYGLFAFQMGVCFVFLLVAMLVRRLDESLPSWPIGAMLLLLFFTHMIAFTLALVLVFFFALQVQRPRLLRQTLLPIVLVVVYAACRFAAGNPDSGVAPPRVLHLGSWLFWAYKLNTFAKSFGFVNPTAWSHSVALAREDRSLFLFLFVVDLVLCFTLAFIFLRNLLLRSSGDRLPFLKLTVALTIPAYLLLPTSLLGIADPGSRVMQSSFWLLLMVCRADGRLMRSAVRIAAAASILLAISGAFLFARLPWTRQAQFTPTHLPMPVEQFGKAPYDAAADLYEALDRDDFTRAVFPTGMLNNLFP
jgi:hypothetical protein